MTTESWNVLKEIHDSNMQIITDMANRLFKEKKTSDLLSRLSKKELQELNTINLNPKQAEALTKFMQLATQDVVFHLLCIIDGVADTKFSLPDLALVDRNSKKEINDKFLHDEFIDMLEA